MRNLLYLVSNIIGEFPEPVAIFSDMELAKDCVSRLEEYYDNCSISREDFEDMYDNVCELEDNDDVLSELTKLYPQYTEEEICRAMDIYDSSRTYNGSYIEEIPYYEKPNFEINGNV